LPRGEIENVDEFERVTDSRAIAQSRRGREVSRVLAESPDGWGRRIISSGRARGQPRGGSPLFSGREGQRWSPGQPSAAGAQRTPKAGRRRSNERLLEAPAPDPNPRVPFGRHYQGAPAGLPPPKLGWKTGRARHATLALTDDPTGLASKVIRRSDPPSS